MHFITDRQTLEDLNIFGKHGDGSIYSLFNHTQTRGGALLLEQLFNEPLSRPDAIRRRIGIFRYFAGAGLSFPCKSEWLDAIEQYLANTDERTKLSHEDAALGSRLKGMIGQNTEHDLILKGVTGVLEMVHTLRGWVATMAADGTDYAEERESFWALLGEGVFMGVLAVAPRRRLGFEQLVELDEMLRFRYRGVVRRLLERVYYLDVYMTIGRVAVGRGLAFPGVVGGTRGPAEAGFAGAGVSRAGMLSVKLRGLYHPALANPVANSIEISPEHNVVFLTGANMAGKSTFMKSLGIALYLAHMGFPVAAAEMEFSVLDGLFTTINLADNLGMGASHFYAEVLRVRKVAEELNRGRNLLVIFDELFRGTNVKDAYEATIAITEAFAGRRNSMFVISTHIIEAGEVLRERCDNIGFVYLPTRMEGHRPVYTYQLERGITDDRHGMVIIRNEGILDILEKGNWQVL